MYDWLSTVNDKFWLILNYSKVVWDIDTKFLAVIVFMKIQLLTKFGASSYTQNGFPPKLFQTLRGLVGAFFESNPCNSGNLLLFSRCTNHISITFWIFWLYKSCKKCWSLPLQVFRASWSKHGSLALDARAKRHFSKFDIWRNFQKW